jgi:O-acetyl-ADP-ribose deacetylase (regulator of RNase III)
MKLSLVDQDLNLVEAWRVSFSEFPEVAVFHNDILAVAECAAVSPANSQGFMDGGIDKAYLYFFGKMLEKDVQSVIGAKFNGMLPVGSATVVPTGHPRIQWLVVAPTMEFPEPVPATISGRALYAALRSSHRHGRISSLFCPGLATGVGRVPYFDAAREMASAYSDWKASLLRR